MQVSVESPSKNERQMTVIVPPEKFDQAYQSRLLKLSKTVKMNGFRPGKVPLDQVQQRYGDSLRQEALGEVIESSLYTALAQEKLSPVSEPKVDGVVANPGQPLEYVATFEIAPQIEKIEFNVNEIEKRVAVLQESDIDRIVEQLRSQHATWKLIDTPAELKDKIILDFTGSIDNVPFDGGKAQDYPIVLGSKMMIPGFEEQLVGHKAGTQAVIEVQFPENYFAKNVAGKAAKFAVEIKKVFRPVYPEMDETLIKKLGASSGKLEDLRAEIQKNLQRELVRAIQTDLKEKVLDLLLTQNPIEDIPKAMIKREASRIHDYMHPHHQGHAHNHTEEEMAGFNEAAKRNVTIGLLLGQFVKQHQITLNKEKLNEHAANLASAYENPEEARKWLLNDRQSRAEMEMHVLENQVMEKLLENVKIKEVTVSYSELMEKGMK